MPRFICFVGEDLEIRTTDDEEVVKQYEDEEWFYCYDTQENVYFVGSSDGKPREAKPLPELEDKEYEGDGEDE